MLQYFSLTRIKNVPTHYLKKWVSNSLHFYSNTFCAKFVNRFGKNKDLENAEILNNPEDYKINVIFELQSW